jgi:hypothetical protein
MRYAKMLGLAALTALALMAVVGAGTASAKGKLCSKSGTGVACAAGHGNVYGEKGKTQKITAVLDTGHATLISGFVNVTCAESHVEGEVTDGATATGFLTSLTFSKCTSNIGPNPCTKAEGTAYPWHLTGTTGVAPNGSLDTGAVTGLFTCEGITCRYGAASAGTKGELDFTGTTAAGATATILATKVPLVKHAGSNFLCSNTATWEGHYKITVPDSLYLT